MLVGSFVCPNNRFQSHGVTVVTPRLCWAEKVAYHANICVGLSKKAMACRDVRSSHCNALEPRNEFGEIRKLFLKLVKESMKYCFCVLSLNDRWRQVQKKNKMNT